MRTPAETTYLIDVQLAHRILELIIEDTRRQSEKKLEIDNLPKAIFEIMQSKRFTPPFDELRSPEELANALSMAKTLFDKSWTDVNEINRILNLLVEHKLLYKVELDSSQYLEPVKLLVLPTGLIMYRKLSELLEMEAVKLEDFMTWILKSHQEHSKLALEVFGQRVENKIRQSQKPSYFNVSLALYLLMYGAINSRHALRIEVDPTNNISEYQDIISNEIKRIGQHVFNEDPIGTQTLLDHFQSSNKIERILSDSRLWVREKNNLQNNRTKHMLYFDLGVKGVNHPETITQLDGLLRALITVAKNRISDADEKIVGLLTEHVYTFNSTVRPIYTKTLFGEVPSSQYVSKLRERVEIVAQSLDSEEYSVNDVDEDEDDEYLEM